MQWMTITSSVPCYAFYVLQHDAVSPFGSLNQIYDFRPICRNSLCISGLGISRHTGLSLEYPSPRWIAGRWRRDDNCKQVIYHLS